MQFCWNDAFNFVMDFYFLFDTSKAREERSIVERNKLASVQPAVPTARDEDDKDTTMVSMKQPMTIVTTTPSYITMAIWDDYLFGFLWCTVYTSQLVVKCFL